MPKITNPLGAFEQEMSLTGAEQVKSDTEIIFFEERCIETDVTEEESFNIKLTDERMEGAEVLRIGYLLLANGSVDVTFIAGGVASYENFEEQVAQTGRVMGWELSAASLVGAVYHDYAYWDCGSGLTVPLTVTHVRAHVHYDYTEPAERMILHAEDYLLHAYEITTSGAGNGTWVILRPFIVIKRKAL